MKRTLTALTTLVLAAGCTSAASSTTHRTVLITEKDAGHVVRLHRGDVVRWVLHSTYWTQRPAAGGELVRTAHRVRAVPPSDRRCVPGQGCGTVETDFRAVATGRVTLRAHRDGCGEAMLCTGDRGRFSVEIVVT